MRIEYRKGPVAGATDKEETTLVVEATAEEIAQVGATLNDVGVESDAIESFIDALTRKLR